MPSDFSKNDESIQIFVGAVQNGFVDLRSDLRDIRERLIRVEENAKNYVTASALTDRIVPMEKKIQTIEQKQPGYLQSSTIAEKIVGIIIGVGIAVLTAFLTSVWGK